MLSEMWRSTDLFNLLRSIYAAKVAAAQASSAEGSGSDPWAARIAFYQQGCQMAVQSLLLAFGHSPQDFYQPDPDEASRRGCGRELWLRTDLENLILSVHDAFASGTCWLPQGLESEEPVQKMRYAGFYDLLVQVLRALGLPATALHQNYWPSTRPLPRLWVEEDGED